MDHAWLKPALVFLGSGIGGILRYWIGLAATARWGSELPIGTLLINASGCFLMGLLTVLWPHTEGARDDLRTALLVGLLGGYTTFSAFGRETIDLAQHGKPLTAAAYALTSVATAIAAVALGAIIAQGLGRLSAR